MKKEMPFSLCFVIVIALLSAFTASGQTPVRPRPNQPQWEYLVVSFGKVYFSDPLTDSEAKSSGLSKLISFSQAGIVMAKEGLTTQRPMDTLGKFGWELVAVVGAIGGDQEMLFKRPYDDARSKQEEESIKQDGDRIRKLLEADRLASSRVAPATELVDLDEVERVEARNALRRAQEDRLRSATAHVSAARPRSILSSSYSPQLTSVSANFVVDGTTQLVSDGNKYRSSAASQLASSTLKSLMTAAGVKESTYGSGYLLGDIKIEVEVVMMHNGKEKVVATARSGGDW